MSRSDKQLLNWLKIRSRMTDYTVDRARWANMTIFDQMGNISSEVGRSFNARRQGQTENERLAMVRALDLFDATIDNLIANKSVRAKEVLRSKDHYLSALLSPVYDEKAGASIEKYFMQYAIAARLNK